MACEITRSNFYDVLSTYSAVNNSGMPMLFSIGTGVYVHVDIAVYVDTGAKTNFSAR